jgi:acetoin utilization protein AcuB
MILSEIINTGHPYLRASDSVEDGIQLLVDYPAENAPVIDFTTRKLLGEVYVSDLNEKSNSGKTLMACIQKKPYVLPPDLHIIDAAGRMFRDSKSVAFIIDENNVYTGTILINDLNILLGRLFNIDDEGAVVMVEVPARDYSLSDIVRIIELENVKILGIGVQFTENDQGLYRISIKLNQQDTTKIIHVLNRYGYIITSESKTENSDDYLHERADELMRYLSI